MLAVLDAMEELLRLQRHAELCYPPFSCIGHVHHLSKKQFIRLSEYERMNAADIRKRLSQHRQRRNNTYFCKQISSLLLSSIAGL